MTTRIRSGAALIIVLLILMALMVLGLPFLFSQSSGLAGSRSLQAAQAARTYRQSAENLGLAIAAYTNEGAWKETTGTDLTAQIHTALELYLAQSPLLSAALIYNPAKPNQLEFDNAKLPGGWNQPGENARIGVAISDESGRLDANTLSNQDWQDLFTALKIPDWDDQQVVVAWTPPQGPDGNITGELADAIVYRRLLRGRYVRLEQLLEADPQANNGNGSHPEFRKRLSRAELERLRPYLSFHNPPPGRDGLVDLGSVIFTDAVPSPTLIPPQVWVDIPGDIIADGQWLVAEDTPGGTQHEGLLRANTSNSFTISYASNIRPAADSALLWQAPPALNLHQLPELVRTLLPAYLHADLPTDKGLLAPTAPVTFYGAQITDASSPTGTSNALPTGFLSPWYTRVSGRPPHARQPIDLRSSGSIRIEAAATIRDHLGNLTAQESRTVIMQAVPQETTLERRWTTQGQFEPLVDQQLANRMATWPNATARATDLVPDDQDPATASASSTATKETGISFATNQSLSVAAKSLTHLGITWRSTLGLNANRIATDAANDEARANSNAGTLFTVRGPPVTDGALKPAPVIQSSGEGLFPDGMRVGSNGVLAYAFSKNSGNPNEGPLTWANPAGTPADAALGLRQLSFWFKPESDWYNGGSGAVVTLMEARANDGYVTKIAPSDLDPLVMVTNTAGKTDRQNYLAVQYDPQQNMLVLAYTPPSASCTASPLPWTAPPDLPDVAGAYWDERCLSGGLLPLVSGRNNLANITTWSKTYQPNRIMTCYKLGRRIDTTGALVANAPEQGRWYHLQVVIGDGRPGGLGLILDGIAGTDVGLMSAKTYVASRKASILKGPWPGDHLTFPSLILTEDLDEVPKPITTVAQAKALYPASIKVEMPGFSSFATDDYSSNPLPVLTPLDTLPARGTALIGDEYIRYESITQNLVAAEKPYGWLLNACTRGTRQDTWTSSADLLERAPTTQKHRSGDRVLADGLRFRPNNGTLYQGGATLTTPMVAGDANGGTNLVRYFGSVTGLAVAPTISFDITAGLPLTIAATGSSGFNDASAPTKGYVRVEINGALTGFYHFTRSGLDFTLTAVDSSLTKVPIFTDPNGPMPSPNPIVNPALDAMRLTLISQEITPDAGNDPLALTSFQPGLGSLIPSQHDWRLAQLLEPITGRCEWIRYTDMLKETDGTVYLLNRRGWGFPDDLGERQRACERTPPPNAPPTSTYTFPAGTLVLPVQPESTFGGIARMLSPGDLITLVPEDYTTNSAVALAVRYAANDGYDGSGDPLSDTVNSRFAFTAPLHGVGLTSSASDYQVVMGSGLTTRRDLTPLGSLGQFQFLSALPRLDAHEAGAKPGRLIFGGQDVVRGGAANPAGAPLMTIDAPSAGPWNTNAGRLQGIFDLSGAPLTSIAATADLPAYIWATHDIFDGPEPLCLVEFGGEVFAALKTTPADDDAQLAAGLTTLLATNPGLLTYGAPGYTPANYVTTFRRRFARLVGRALLGSGSTAHNLVPAVDNAQLTASQQAGHDYLAYGQEVMRLPVGPIRFLTDATQLVAGGTNIYEMSDGVAINGTFTAPSALIAEPVRSAPEPWKAQQEIMHQGAYDGRSTLSSYNPASPTTPTSWPNPNYQKWLTARWLRGMYNTNPNPTTPWADYDGGHGKLHPLVIGWWTRFPSALPSLVPTGGGAAGALTAQHLRCRHYPWAGFLFNLHDVRFDNNHPPEFGFDPMLSTNTVLTETNPNLQMEVRAMAGAIAGQNTVAGSIGDTSGTGFSDWTRITPVIPTLPGSAGWVPIPNLFTWNPGGGPDTAKPTTGVEVRVAFRYTGKTSGDLSDIARAANRAPLISGFKLRAHAPVATLAVEDAR